MTVYTYSKVAVYAELGGAVRLARNARSFVTDAVTGLPVNVTQGASVAPYLDSDANGIADFTAENPGPIRLTTGAVFVDVYSEELPGLSFAAVASSAASAVAASASADAAALSASLVGAPADSAVAAIVGTPASATSVVLSSTYRRVFTPEAYGAIGNGVADDTTAVNAAITAANAAKGGTVYFAGTYKITTSLTCSGVKDVLLTGTTHARTTGSGIVWAGADGGSTIKADNAEGLSIVGLSFTATSATFAGRHIDFVNTGTMPQAIHILIEWCFFSGGAQLHTDIHTGGGHNYTIRNNDFYKSNIAIRGYEQAVTPAQSVQSCLVERNWFESFRGTCHIADPGAGWKITCNAVECITGGIGGFVRLLNATPALVNVTIEDNWCGDVTTTVTLGAQVEVAGGPFTIRNNLLGAGAAGSASLRAVGILGTGCTISDNRYDGSSAGAFIVWGAFAHLMQGSPNSKTGAILVTGNRVPDGVTMFSGTLPPRLVHDSGGTLVAPPSPVALIASTTGTLAIDATAARGGSYTAPTASITAFTISNPTGNGQLLTIMLQQPSAGNLTTVWPASFKFAGGVAPAWTGAYVVTSVTMKYLSSGAFWREVSRAANMPI